MKKPLSALGSVVIGIAVVAGVQGENHIINPSFEVGTYGWTWEYIPRMNYTEAAVAVTADRNTPTAAPELGDASLKIIPVESFAQHIFNYTFRSQNIILQEGREYTLSFYAKAAHPLGISLTAEAPKNTDWTQKSLLFVDRQEFRLGPAWQRYSVRFKTAPPAAQPGLSEYPPCRALRFELKWGILPAGGAVWFDGFQVSEGELGKYDDGSPFFGAGESDQPSHIYPLGKKPDPVFRFYRSRGDDPAAYRVRYETLEALTGNRIGDQTVPATFAAGERHITQSTPYVLPSDRIGLFKTILHLYAGDKVIGYSEFMHAVYQPMPVPADFDDTSLFAMDAVCWGSARASPDRMFQMASDIGVRHYREETKMRDECPAPGVYNFNGTADGIWSREGMIRTAEKYKIRPMICIGPLTGKGYMPNWMFTDQFSKTPTFYEGNNINNKRLPQDIQYNEVRTLDLKALENYCAALAAHFKGRIKYYEIFNESFWYAEYSDYWRTVYTAIKRADPDVKVMPNIMRCEFASVIPDFNGMIRDRFQKQGLAQYCDAVSLHLYTFPVDDSEPEYNLPGFQEIYDAWKKLFQECNRPNIELLETEGGYRTSSYYNHIDPVAGLIDRRPDQVRQAQRAVRKWIMFQNIGYTKLFYFYFFSNMDVWQKSPGLLEYDNTPKLIYLAAGNTARRLTGAKSLGKVPFAGSKIWGYRMESKGGEQFVVLWHVDETPVDWVVNTAPGTLHAEDMLGNQLNLKNEGGKTVIPLNGSPVYVFAGGTTNAFDAVAQGEPVGLVPVQFAIELARNPESSRPAVVVAARNVGGRDFNGIFQVAGLPREWQAAGARLGIGGVPVGGERAAYLDLTHITAVAEPVALRAFYSYGGQMLAARRDLSRVALMGKRREKIKIDGTLDEQEWQAAGPGFVIDRPEQVVVEMEPVKLVNRLNAKNAKPLDWKSPSDFSSTHKALWDEKALYLASHVRTPNYVRMKTSPDRICDSICLELFLSLNTMTNAWDNLYHPSDYQLLFAPPAPDIPRWQSVAGRGLKPFQLQGVEMAAAPAQDGYTVELRIPWKNFPEAKRMISGTVIGLNLAVDSAFADGNRQWQMAWTGGSLNCYDTSQFPRWVLVDKISATESAQPAPPPGAPIINQTNVNVSCASPGIYAIRWLYQVERPEPDWTTMNFTTERGPLLVRTEPGKGVEPYCSFYGYANQWYPCAYYFMATNAGNYTFAMTAQNIPGVERVMMGNIVAGQAQKADFEKDNLLADGGFENGGTGFSLRYSTWQQIKNGQFELEYALDRNEFFEGRQSLRMVCRKGIAEMISAPLPVVSGRDYLLEFWIKGKDDRKLQEFRAGLMSADGGNVIYECNITVGGKWKKLAGTVRLPKVGFFDERVVFLRFLTGSMGTYWVDGIKMRLKDLKRAEDQEKLIIESRGDIQQCRYQLTDIKDNVFVSLNDDTQDYIQGNSALRLENKAETVSKEVVVGVPKKDALKEAVFLNLRSEPFALQAGRNYTLTFWARSDAGLLKVWSAIEPQEYKTEPITDQFYKGRERPYEQVVEVGKEWKKYTLNFTVPKNAKGPYRHLVRYTDKSVLWLDELKITEKN